MKNKIFSVVMTVMMAFGLMPALSPAALADNGHGKEVSEFARSFKATKGEHGRLVSELARSRHSDDDDDDEDEDRGRGRGINSGPGNARDRIAIGNITNIGVLEALIARLQALLAELIRMRGGEADTAAPVIAGVAATELRADGVKIVWTTNEFADSKVFFSTSSPVDPATASVRSKGALEINHRVSLDGLASSTTYFYLVESRDRAGNVARSAQFSFTTLPLNPVEAAPVISAISVSAISSSSATVSWTTDKPATSKVYFSTSSPVDVATAQSVSSTALVTSRAVVLTGLTASTTHFFIVESADAGGRISRSGQGSFVTLP